MNHVMIAEQRAINVEGLKNGLNEAKAFGADVVIVDHIDHIEGDDRSSLASPCLSRTMAANAHARCAIRGGYSWDC